MSRSTLRKGIVESTVSDDATISPQQRLVKILQPCGGPLWQVEYAKQQIPTFIISKKHPQLTDTVLTTPMSLDTVQVVEPKCIIVSLPKKFHQLFWLKKDGYVLIDIPNEWSGPSTKIRGTICRPVTHDLAQKFVDSGLWPQEFPIPESTKQVVQDENVSGDDEEDELMGRPQPKSLFYENDEEDLSSTSDDDE